MKGDIVYVQRKVTNEGVACWRRMYDPRQMVRLQQVTSSFMAFKHFGIEETNSTIIEFDTCDGKLFNGHGQV